VDQGLPKGYRAAGVRGGIKPSGGLDVAVIVADETCAAAGTFTTNRFAAAPVVWDRAILPSESIRAIVVNAGNANAATGSQGASDVKRTAEAVARQLACHADQVLVASTGVIGVPLPMDRLEPAVLEALGQASAGAEGFQAASEAILTTDTRPKWASRVREVEEGRLVRVFGVAKGAAMIAPHMATMLGFLITDARVTPGALQGILTQSVEETFNRISVDGDTSTNDSVLMLAAGKGEAPLEGPALRAFSEMVREVCDDLARQIVEDGEGATHLLTVDAIGASDRDAAVKIARAVAESLLVKTAIHGADPNWGRILMAIGRSGAEFDPEQLRLELQGVVVFEDGAPVPVDADALSSAIRQQREVSIRVTLRDGDGAARFRSCDLTAEYVRLNADYTT